MEEGLLGMSWLMAAVACLVVTAVYVVVWPRPQVAAASSAWTRLVLRWFHALVWLLLAISFLARGAYIPGGATLAGTLAMLALICYGTFMFTLIRARRRTR
jgi:hypothetical protein